MCVEEVKIFANCKAQHIQNLFMNQSLPNFCLCKKIQIKQHKQIAATFRTKMNRNKKQKQKWKWKKKGHQDNNNNKKARCKNRANNY